MLLLYHKNNKFLNGFPKKSKNTRKKAFYRHLMKKIIEEI
jgi:hypothetical protein